MPGRRMDDEPPAEATSRGTLGERLRSAFLKPEPPPDPAGKGAKPSIDELRTTAKSMDDKERLVGLFAAPCAAAIGFLVIAALVANDPAAKLPNGHPNRLHVSVALYHEVFVVLLVMALAMLGTALLRKRMFLGIV